MNIRTMAVFTVLLLAVGCAAKYAPTAGMLNHKSNMTKDDAIKIYNRHLFPDANSPVLITGFPYNICNTNEFSLDSKANVKLAADGLSMTAFKLGEVVKREEYLTHHKKVFYNKTIKFSDIGKIVLSNKASPTMLTGNCFDKEDYIMGSREKIHDAVIIFKTGMFEFFGMRIPETEVDEFIAAVSILMPNAEMIVAVDD